MNTRHVMGSAAAAALLLIAPAARTQQKASPTIAPRYRGESICLARPGICHDEVVVYHLTPVKGDAARYDIDANKVVNGAEESMGIIPCTLAGAALRCVMPQGTWTFAVRGDSLVGGLTLADGTPMRRVRVKASGR